MEEGELFRGVDGEGGVRSREADLLPLLLHHRWKQLPHPWTCLCGNNWVLKSGFTFLLVQADGPDAELQLFSQEKVLQSICKSAVSNEEVHLQFTWQCCKSEVLDRWNH